MNKIYNTQEDIASGFRNFLKLINPNIRKTQLNFLPYLLFGIIASESISPFDIAKNLKEDFSLIQLDSVKKRIKRFFSNKHFHPYEFFDLVIKYVISTYKKKHNDKRIHIIFDHMFSHDNYTVFMISMRIGKQGIPIWFRCFEGKDCPDAFKEELIKEGISYVSNLFPNDFELIFLADRWFNSTGLMKHIDSLGHTYVLRMKQNIKVFYFDKNEGHKVWKTLQDLPRYKHRSIKYEKIQITDSKYTTNIVISDSIDTNDPWVLVSNKNLNRSVKDYSYRFGGIKCLFKNQKSNGFYLEKTVNASLKYFESMYSILCTVSLYLTLLGSDFAKNTKCYKNVKISTHTSSNGKRIRILSLFNTGLTLFHLAFNSLRYIRLPFNFVLYDS